MSFRFSFTKYFAVIFKVAVFLRLVDNKCGAESFQLSEKS